MSANRKAAMRTSRSAQQPQSKGKESNHGYRKSTTKTVADSDADRGTVFSTDRDTVFSTDCGTDISTMAVYKTPITGLPGACSTQSHTEDEEDDSDCESVATDAAVYLGPPTRKPRQDPVDYKKNNEASSSRQSHQTRVDAAKYRKFQRQRAYKDGEFTQSKELKSREVKNDIAAEEKTDKRLFFEKHETAASDGESNGKKAMADRKVEKPSRTDKIQFKEKHQTIKDEEAPKSASAQKASSGKPRPVQNTERKLKDSTVKARPTIQRQPVKSEHKEKESLPKKFFKWFTKDFDKAIANNW